MKKTLLLLLLGFLSTAANAEPNMQDGMWEITSKMEMPGMPAAAMQPMKHTQCMTKSNAVPTTQPKDKNNDCKMTSTKVEGNTVTWSMQCRGKEGDTDSSGKITYSGNSFSGETKISSNIKGQGKMDITQRMSGKRIGDCK
ncbi:DUF3617 domain-containing protein [Sulfurirhabdus autotrophica]|uniref:Uncharacterized protein DUF3617 n=1 Tax=Sulfurirhabdus autotrophica TaxID=1706046 RepID=A0A4R3YEZ5_9PROT|nr:DUF3617 family protein [Sulfurirhabdus autotrophica]TCV89043.1 uncharacterized protein DUF3617 [Sulfurirhabdus autotrophica]